MNREIAEPRGCPTPGACSALHRIAELEAALAYYADPDEYLARGSGLTARVLTDAGAVARKALPRWEDVEPVARAGS